MLRELSIQNFALIDDLRISFTPGLTVLTGETGAGKSILIDALEVALGGRAGEEQVRTAAQEAVVEGAWDDPPPEVREILAEEGISGREDEFLVLRRHVLREGKSKAYVNGRLSSASTLKALGESLVDLHGQHEGASLLNPRKHLSLLDAYAGLSEQGASYRSLYARRQALLREREALSGSEREKAQRRDLLEYQRKEIEAAGLREGEEEELQSERVLLSHAEKLSTTADKAYGSLEGEDDALLGRLAPLLVRLREGAQMDPRLGETVRLAEEAIALLGEAAAELRDYRGRIRGDPARLEAVEERLFELTKLKRKYGASVAEILQCREKVVTELTTLEHSTERLAEIEQELSTVEAELLRQADLLSSRRAAAARDLEEAIRGELRDLGMPQAAFHVDLQRVESALTGTGRDEAEFLVSTNPGEEVKPLHRVASGGELSRTLLALKSLLAAVDHVPTLIFDEVDVGIGGAMASTVGRKLCALARERQVLCITHLAPLAVLGDVHLQVMKRSGRGKTDVTVRALGTEERVAEVARMLGGAAASEIPLEHAREMLQEAGLWKRGSRKRGGARQN